MQTRHTDSKLYCVSGLFSRCSTMIWILYQAALTALLLLVAPWLLLTRRRHYLPTLRGRLARADTEVEAGETRSVDNSRADSAGTGAARPLWIHAVSVGEVAVAATLARELPSEIPLVVTTVTPTGQERARATFAGRATVGYLPFRSQRADPDLSRPPSTSRRRARRGRALAAPLETARRPRHPCRGRQRPAQ